MAITLETFVKLPTSRKILILFVLIGVAVGLFIYLVYFPNRDVLNKKKADLEKLERDVRELRAVAADVKRFQAEAAELRAKLEVAMKQLPTSKEIPTLLSNISKLGKESGLEFILFKPTPEIGKEFYAEIPVEVRVKGTYSNVAIFFDKVGKLDRIVNISEVSMDNAKEIVGRWETTTSCVATTFKFLEKEAADAVKDQAKDKKAGEAKAAAPPATKK